MEMWARYAHKALWHDFEPGWALHKSHHVPRVGPFEDNDVFALVNAIPAMGLCAYGFLTPDVIGGVPPPSLPCYTLGRCCAAARLSGDPNAGGRPSARLIGRPLMSRGSSFRASDLQNRRVQRTGFRAAKHPCEASSWPHPTRPHPGRTPRAAGVCAVRSARFHPSHDRLPD